MLFLTMDDAHARPVFLCDICGKEVLGPADAAVVYPRGLTNGEVVRIQLAHRGECFRASELTLANDQGHVCWMDFDEYLRRLPGLTADIGDNTR